ncbi:MAG: glucose-6-phosphate isomerase [Gammaproteobacteria bacterium]|nr:glucose-6-phosphate isomerase [Gammaproteobacteria bacterium]
MTQLTQQACWTKLKSLQQKITAFPLAELYLAEPNRFANYSITIDNLTLDYSKNYIDRKILASLFELARVAQVEAKREALFAGELVNQTEQRAALHMALRSSSDFNWQAGGVDINADIFAVNKKWQALAAALEDGKLKGCTGERITDIINVGIGGSDQGPLLLVNALQDYCNPNCRYHFISYQGPQRLTKLLTKLNPATTLVIIVSKSFTTWETMTHAKQILTWFNQFDQPQSLSQHIYAVSSNVDKACELGVSEENVLPIWDWVGGRFSVWSVVSLIAMLALGVKNFKALLAGAKAMDQHFLQSELEENAPVILALLSIWYGNFFDAQAHAILPYHSQLTYLPGFVQQLFMESLGKSITQDGESVNYKTGQVMLGAVGAHSQHSFMQLLQQGTQFVPVDFILPLGAEEDDYAISNCLAQSEILMSGDNEVDSRHRFMHGNIPSNTLILKGLTPFTLGQLLALYEHQVFVQAAIWNINAFDQWGVERGKQLAKQLNIADQNDQHPATKALLKFITKDI